MKTEELKAIVDIIEAALKSEVETFSAYLAGEVFGWVIFDENGTELDSCFGYFAEKDAEDDAKQELTRLRFERVSRHEHTLMYGG